MGELDREKFTEELGVAAVHVSDRFWSRRMEQVRTKVLPYEWEALNDRIPGASTSHAVANFQLARELTRNGRKHLEDWNDGFRGFVFQDSDIAKWLEAVAYTLMWHADAELERTADEVIELVCDAQQEDGYLDTYYIIHGLEQRWTNLQDNHELYCLGHMLEAAVAYYDATKKERLLNAMIRYVDYVDSIFGPEPEKKKGYPGHEVIELALIRLYQITKNERHLNLARYFIHERGKEPNYFAAESVEQNREKPENIKIENYTYYQAHKPVIEQEVAVGHAVRAVYLYSGMADVARYTMDEDLYAACERLWKNMTTKQMYITGSIGATPLGEAFTFDYDLPNQSIYGETCAAIGLAFFAKRMLQISPKAEYADVLEKVLYNGIISGISLDGTRFFYVNPLEVYPEANRRDERLHHVKVQRQKWFGCACCPPNIARIMASVGNYFYTANDRAFYTHIPASASVKTTLSGKEVSIVTESEYPWDGTIHVRFNMKESAEFLYGIRVPGWCGKWEICLNKEAIAPEYKDGYLLIHRTWNDGDEVEFMLEMNVQRMEAHPMVRQDKGKVAVMRGPVVYCLEEADNGKNLHLISIKGDAKFTARLEPDLGEIVALYGKGYREVKSMDERLYRPVSEKRFEEVELKWIPYYAWANREEGEMTVWVNKK